MSRVADALKRARTGSAAGSSADEDRSGDLIQFFAPGKPAVVTPWEIDSDELETLAVAEQLRRTQIDAAARPAPLEPAGTEPVQWPLSDLGDKLVVSPHFAPGARDQYNKLAATLHQAQLEHGMKVVMLTSATQGEGKSLTAVNLALMLSESYRRRVLLVDADLRHPMLHELLGLPNQRGLSDSLAAEEPFPLLEVTSWLSVLTGGAGGDDPMKTLTSDRMRSLIEEARDKFDWIVLDTPPAGLMPDAKLLASMADMTLLVAMAGTTPYDVIQRAAEALGPDRIFGVVLNRVTDTAALPHPYERSYYARLRRRS